MLVVALAAPALAQAPNIDHLGSTSRTRSGRLKIFGSGFGASAAGSTVQIAGIRAWTATWTDGKIVAYVPEGAPLGTVPVQVSTASEQSNTATLDVTSRQPQGRVRWRFEADSANLWWRPAIGPDGTIFVHGSQGYVYALTPDGGLKWLAQVQAYPYGPPAAGADGSSYYASIQTVFALNPDGTERWTYTDAGTQAVTVGPGVGPGGNVFVANDFGLGALALASSGTPLWNNPGNPTMWQYGGTGAEMVFGSTRPMGRIDSFYVAMDRQLEGRLYGFTLSGQQRFAVPVGSQDSPFRQQQIQPAVGPDGTVYVTHMKGFGAGWSLEAFRPQDGQSLWYHAVGADLSPPEVGPDGIVYLATQSGVSAFDPAAQQVLWNHSDGTIADHPTVSPLNDMLVMSGVETFGMPGYVKAIDHAGQLLWKVPLPGKPYPAPRLVGVHRPRFTPDGKVAYISTTFLAPPPGDPYSFLYAITTTEVP
jgi:hypothetical protein